MPLDTMSELDDDALLLRYGAGDPAAAAALTFRLTPRALSLATRLLGDVAEAEDVAQEAMLRLWKMAPGWRRGEAKVTTWLYTVVRNLATDRLRKRRSVALDDIPEPVDQQPGAEAQMLRGERAKALNHALADLPERQRTAVVLRHFEGMANPDIAEVIGVSTEAVESLIARGKRNLHARLVGDKQKLGLEE